MGGIELDHPPQEFFARASGLTAEYHVPICKSPCQIKIAPLVVDPSLLVPYRDACNDGSRQLKQTCQEVTGYLILVMGRF